MGVGKIGLGQRVEGFNVGRFTVRRHGVTWNTAPDAASCNSPGPGCN
jgi:hypothetical protein